MFQIQTMNKISPAGLDRFDRAKYTWGDEMTAPDAHYGAFCRAA